MASQRCPGVSSPDSYAVITNWARSWAYSLVMIRLTWVLAVCGEMTSNSAMSAFDWP